VRIRYRGRMGLSISASIVAFLLIAVHPAIAAAGPSVRGGGVVDGLPGVTSQLGFSASANGGSFLCAMAGRSGGFAFDPWDEVLQMEVQGRVTPGSLEIEGSWSRFEGVADIHVVGMAAGQVLTARLTGVAFASEQGAGGAGEARHLLVLELPGGDLSIGPEFMKTGRITIHD
jgi:hypothetical protein